LCLFAAEKWIGHKKAQNSQKLLYFQPFSFSPSSRYQLPATRYDFSSFFRASLRQNKFPLALKMQNNDPTSITQPDDAMNLLVILAVLSENIKLLSIRSILPVALPGGVA
jgi:hypothetical protein